MYVKRYAVTLTASTTEGVTAYTTDAVDGRVLQIVYCTGSSLGTSATLTVTGEKSKVAILTKKIAATAGTFCPRQSLVTTTGGVVANATNAGVTLVREPVYVGQERIKFVVADAPAAGVGTLHVYVG